MDLTQLATAASQTGSKIFEQDGRVDWGGSANLSKTWSRSSRGVNQFSSAHEEIHQLPSEVAGIVLALVIGLVFQSLAKLEEAQWTGLR
jgi:hypothetical protein